MSLFTRQTRNFWVRFGDYGLTMSFDTKKSVHFFSILLDIHVCSGETELLDPLRRCWVNRVLEAEMGLLLRWRKQPIESLYCYALPRYPLDRPNLCQSCYRSLSCILSRMLVRPLFNSIFIPFPFEFCGARHFYTFSLKGRTCATLASNILPTVQTSVLERTCSSSTALQIEFSLFFRKRKT